MHSDASNIKLALLTRSEIEWLLGKKRVSKAYEYYLRHSIKDKLQTLMELEIPLLTEKGMLQDNLNLSAYSKNLSANSKVNKQIVDLSLRRDWSSGQDIGFPSQLRGFEMVLVNAPLPRGSRIPHIIDVYDAGSQEDAL